MHILTYIFFLCFMELPQDICPDQGMYMYMYHVHTYNDTHTQACMHVHIHTYPLSLSLLPLFLCFRILVLSVFNVTNFNM